MVRLLWWLRQPRLTLPHWAGKSLVLDSERAQLRCTPTSMALRRTRQNDRARRAVRPWVTAWTRKAKCFNCGRSIHERQGTHQ